MTRLQSPRAGFSLLEIVIAISVLAIIAGVVGLRSGSVIEKSKATNALQMIDTLKSASIMYHTDTGQFAREYAGYGASARNLTATQSVAGWAGPYIENQLPVNANPWGGTTHLYNTVTAGNWIPGFDFDGDGTLDVTGAGNMVYMQRADEAAAQAVDAAIDKSTPGNWNETGRVRYVSSGQRLLVLVHW